MKLYAISDLHLANKINFHALEALPSHPKDWLILAGDLGEIDEYIKIALYILTRRFQKVLWIPGNHDLWTIPSYSNRFKGEAKYRNQISICRDYGVLTPEDPYVTWDGEDGKHVLVPMFLLYDYSFRPDNIPEEKALEWAMETGVVCTDEELLHCDPYKSRAEWCRQRCDYTEERLKKIPPHHSIVLINHFPLLQEMAVLQRFPAFSLWCGTTRTKDWHTRFNVSVVVYGHMHMRSTQFRDGVRFEEVSFGYPRDWNHSRSLNYYLRQILPHPK
ncbi:MAG: metallophosphoesterase [bacterium]|nr:metallophosphoesterase [bacterium]